MKLKEIDIKLINFFRQISVPFARFSLFVVYFWFGILKVFGMSPASPLVQALFERTVPFMSFQVFIILFGLFECLLGIMFLISRLDRIALILLGLHMIATWMPLFVLPEATWSGFLTPTLEGQYIIKNLLIIAAAMQIGANLKPIEKTLSNK